MTEAESPDAGAQCPWCAAPVAAEATRCSVCGAALAQRESIAGVVIPGLTAVDPALEDFDKRPLHIRGPSPSQGMAPALIVAAAAGGPIGLMAIGGVAAVVAGEYMTIKRDGPDGGDLDSVGKPSEVLLQALEHLEDGTLVDPTTSAAAPPSDSAGSPPAAAGAASAPGSPDAAPPDAAATGDGLSIWRDLPPVDPMFARPDVEPTSES